MENMNQSPFGDIAGLIAAILGPQAKVDLATNHWVARFKEEVLQRRPSIENESAPDFKLIEELAETHLDPIKAAREYLLRVYNQPRAADDTFDLDPFGDKTKMPKKDRATIAAMEILWDNDFLVGLKETAPVLGERTINTFDWNYIAELYKQQLSPCDAAVAYIAKMHPELVTKQ